MRSTPPVRAIGAFRLAPIALACLATSAGAQTPAQAPGISTQLDTVVVTGIRRGIEAAISVKKNNDLVVEAISAEDIGKLPDASIAESISRLPGVTAQRTGGRAQEISIRGLSGDFATTLMNGREQVSTSDNRSAQFDQYPAELLSAVTIYKTPDASLVGQGLAGTIDLQTVRPLNFSKRAVALNARAERQNAGMPGEGKGSRLSASYIDQFWDRKLGVALGVARLSVDSTVSVRNGYLDDVTVNCGAGADLSKASVCLAPGQTAANGTVVKAPAQLKFFMNQREEQRDGFMGVVEFKPTKDISTLVDLYYSKFNYSNVRTGIEWALRDTWSGGTQRSLENAVIVDGRIDSGTWVGSNGVVANNVDDNKTKLKAAGWTTNWTLSDTLRSKLDVSYSHADRLERPYETWSGLANRGGDRIAFTNAAGGADLARYTPSLSYTDTSIIKLMDAAGWGIDGYLKELKVEDETKAAKLTFDQSLDYGIIRSLQYGGHVAKRSKSRAVPEWQLQLIGKPAGAAGSAADANGNYFNVPVPASANPRGMTMGDLGFDILAYDSKSIANLYNYVGNNYYDIFQKAWQVDETLKTAFVKADLETEFFGKPLTGNVGLQMVRADQRSFGNDLIRVDANGNNIDGNPQVITYNDGKTTTDFLPSLNLKWELGGDQIVRLGVARVMSRPRMDQMTATGYYGVGPDTTPGSPTNGQNVWSGSGGNPRLNPVRANAFDLSYEKYFGNKGYVSAAYFYKDLRSFIINAVNENFDFTGKTNPRPAVVPISNIGHFTQPQNLKGGSLQGVELAASIPLNLLWKPLDGFGLVFNYGYTDSKIKPFGDGDTRPLPGLSRDTANITLYYEANGFSARIAQRYRSSFLGEITGFATNREFRYIGAETITDLQVGYEFQSGWLKGLSTVLQVNNLNETAYRELDSVTKTVTAKTEYGRNILLGLNYKF